MSASDSRPVPRKNVAWRHYFAVRKNDGTLATTWAGADSEVSLDGGAYADCTNEATEIGSSGTGYIDLTAAEMNADAVLYKLTVTNTDALPIVVTIYPEEAGDYRADAIMISGDATAADNLEAAADGTGYNLGGGLVVASSVTAPVGVGGLNSGVLDAAAVDPDFWAALLAAAEDADGIKADIIAANGNPVADYDRLLQAGASAAATEIQLAASESSVNDALIDVAIELQEGTARQVVRITDYVGSTRTATITPALAFDVTTSTRYTVTNYAGSGGGGGGATAAEVWSYGSRVLTAGTNIVLAKGTGVTGFNDLSTSQVNAEADAALADAGLTTTVTGRIDAAMTSRAPASTALTNATWTDAKAGYVDAAISTRATVAAMRADLDATPLEVDIISVLGESVEAVGGVVDANVTHVDGDTITDYVTAERASFVTAVFAFVLENGKTFAQFARAWTAALKGKATGMRTGTATFRDDADTKNRIVETLNANGDRVITSEDLT